MDEISPISHKVRLSPYRQLDFLLRNNTSNNSIHLLALDHCEVSTLSEHWIAYWDTLNLRLQLQSEQLAELLLGKTTRVREFNSALVSNNTARVRVAQGLCLLLGMLGHMIR